MDNINLGIILRCLTGYLIDKAASFGYISLGLEIIQK